MAHEVGQLESRVIYKKIMIMRLLLLLIPCHSFIGKYQGKKGLPDNKYCTLEMFCISVIKSAPPQRTPAPAGVLFTLTIIKHTTVLIYML